MPSQHPSEVHSRFMRSPVWKPHPRPIQKRHHAHRVSPSLAIPFDPFPPVLQPPWSGLCLRVRSIAGEYLGRVTPRQRGRFRRHFEATCQRKSSPKPTLTRPLAREAVHRFPRALACWRGSRIRKRKIRAQRRRPSLLESTSPAADTRRGHHRNDSPRRPKVGLHPFLIPRSD